LDIKLHEINTSEKEVEATYTYDEIKEELEKEIKKKLKTIQIQGFRKGKAPLPFVKKIYGDALEYEASEKIANTKFWEIVQEKDLNPINTPVITDIKFEPQGEFSFKIRFEVVPVLEVRDYTGFDIELPKLEIKESDVDFEIKNIKNAHRQMEDTDTVGDSGEEIITVNVVRLDENNNEIEGTLAEKIQIDLSNEKVQPEILENAKGKKTGDTFTFSFTDERMIENPEGQQENVSETFNYRAEIFDIKKIVLPELNEEFLKKTFNDKISSESELRADIRKNLNNYIDKQIDDLQRSKIIEKIIENNPFVPPHSMVHRYLDQILKSEEERAKQQKMRFNREEMSKKMHSVAEFELKWYMLKEKIKEKENITVTDEEMNETAQKESDRTGITIDKLLNYYNSSGFKNNLADQKLFEYLKNNNTVKFVEPKKRNIE
jgi:trigger factor